VPRQDLTTLLRGHQARWHQNEKNTAELLKAVVSARNGKQFSGEDIYHLLRLTWVTSADDHWRKLKIPALINLFPQSKPVPEPRKISTLRGALSALRLPNDVALAAARTTGIVNVYGPWRNSSGAWCAQNAHELRKIIQAAKTLKANDQGRLTLARRIDGLPKISSPSSQSNARPEIVVTPRVACLDPHSRFPIVNGRKSVQPLLARLELKGRNLEEQVRGMTGLIGRFGITDSFMLDVLADRIKKVAPKLNIPIAVRVIAPTTGSAIPDFDDSERKYLRQAGTIRYRHRHNKMTRELKRLLHRFTLTQGTKPDCRWDALIEHYERTGRDLLLEVKPDPQKAAIRIAIGQLLDYRRFVPRPATTDIALLTMRPPDKLYRQLLLDVQISVIWFTDEECGTLDGEGLLGPRYANHSLA
jgi:hypothetical protein